MKVKKTLVAAAAAATIGLAGVGGGMAFAQSDIGGGTIVDRIAQKFNLNKDEVKAVFDEERTAREAEMEASISKKLDQAMKAGKLTTEQKSLIESKLKEIRTLHETERTTLEGWATQNKVDLKFIMFGRHGIDDNRLQSAVDAGDMTAEQKKLIEDKTAELKAKHEEARTALRQWAKDNNIDTQYLMGFGSGPHGFVRIMR
jgi:hypothetical protein